MGIITGKCHECGMAYQPSEFGGYCSPSCAARANQAKELAEFSQAMDKAVKDAQKAVEKPIDWSIYLPKEPLPDTGPKEFKAGQVIAWGGGSISEVVRMTDSDSGDVVATSSKFAQSPRTTGLRHLREAVLVQDVGESRPRPVEEVFGKSPPTSPWVDMPHFTGPAPRGLCPEGISAAQVSDWAKPRREPWRRGESEQPTGVSEAELERLANPWRRR